MKRLLVIIAIWIVILGCGALAFKYLVLDPNGPFAGSTKDKEERTANRDKKDSPKDGKEDEDPNKEKDVVKDKKSDPQLPKVRLALDSFSGYCIFRSPEFKKRLAGHGLDFEWVDDGAKYAERAETIKSGDTPLAVFTIDALLLQTPPGGESPATIVMMIDETCGADAMVSYQQGIKDLDALNSPNAKVVLAEGTPSETLLRVVRSQFNLPQLPIRKRDYLINAADAKDVLDKFQHTLPSERKAFVLWEPYVSAALKQPGAHLLVDSSQFKGYIVDVLVVQPEYLRKYPERVEAIVRAYQELLFEVQKPVGGMTELLKADALLIKEDPSTEKAQQVAKGIWWKNTMENYGHFGLLPPEQNKNLQPVRGMIAGITRVLDKTKEPDEPELRISRVDKMVTEDVLRRLYDRRPSLHENLQSIREDDKIGPLSPAEWKALIPVASVKMPEIKFSSKNKDQLTDDSETQLAEVAALLRQWPQYYWRIEGNTLKEGDREANMELASRRARAVREYLVDKMGIEDFRLRSQANEPSGVRDVRIVALRRP